MADQRLGAGPWVTEFGSPDVKKDFTHLYRYSPYHNVKERTSYPAMMFVSGDADVRVAPLHSRKMTARVQSASISGRPVLLRYDPKRGHGTSSGEDLVDEFLFLFSQVGLTFQDGR